MAAAAAAAAGPMHTPAARHHGHNASARLHLHNASARGLVGAPRLIFRSGLRGLRKLPNATKRRPETLQVAPPTAFDRKQCLQTAVGTTYPAPTKGRHSRRAPSSDSDGRAVWGPP